MVWLPKPITATIGDFAGRRWLLPILLAWFEHSHERYFFLTGEPGSGKSLIAAWLMGYGPVPDDPEAKAQLERLRAHITAGHFCVAESGSTSPKACAEDLANQLTDRVEGFTNALAASLTDLVQIRGEVHAGEIRPGGIATGVYIGHLDLAALPEETSFDQALRDPLKNLYADGYDKPMILLVDALDEALTRTGYGEKTNLIRLLAQLKDLPQQVRLLVTTRPDPRVLKYFREAKHFDLIRDASESADDIRFYIYKRLTGLTDEQRGMAAQRIVDAAEGNFLYTHLVLTDLLPHLPTLSNLMTLPLPVGLTGIYESFLNREIGADESKWYKIFRSVLGLLAVARGEGLTCIGYLDHPFKNKPFETGKDLLPCLQTQEGWCRISNRRQHPHARTTRLLRDGETSSMAGVLTYLQQLKDGCLHALSSRFTRWTKPLTSSLLLQTLTDLSRSKSELVAENALLRQQLLILRRQVKRPSISRTDRALLVLLARLVRTWNQALFVVQPETLLRWHRELFRWYWKRKSKAHARNPKVAEETIALIRQMAKDNRLWGAERIRGELLKLGIHVCKRTIQKYMRTVRTQQPRGQRWATFLRNHAAQIWACDFLQITDLFFRPLFAFFLIELMSRKVIHVGVTRSPSDPWVAQQLREATPYGRAPKYLIRDNDSKFGSCFDRVATTSGIKILKTPYHAPRANAVCERFLRSVRQECLDHLFIFGEKQLQRVLNAYVAYFNQARPHQGIGQQIPEQRRWIPFAQDAGNKVIARPVMGGLHHDYRWAA